MPTRYFIPDMVSMLARVPYAGIQSASLTSTQWSVLRFLARANRFSRTVSGIAAYQATTRGTASQLVKTLETKGLVVRTPDARDRRSARLDLTDEGRTLLADDPMDTLVQAAANLSDTDRQMLTVTLRRLMAEVVRLKSQPIAGQCEQCVHLESLEPPVGNMLMRCGFTGQGLTEAELTQVCVGFQFDETTDQPAHAPLGNPGVVETTDEADAILRRIIGRATAMPEL